MSHAPVAESAASSGSCRIRILPGGTTSGRRQAPTVPVRGPPCGRTTCGLPHDRFDVERSGFRHRCYRQRRGTGREVPESRTQRSWDQAIARVRGTRRAAADYRQGIGCHDEGNLSGGSRRMKWKLRLVRDLRKPHILGVHGLHQVCTAKVEKSCVVGLARGCLNVARSIARKSARSWSDLQTWMIKTLPSP